MTDKQPEALRLADELDAVPETGADPQTIQDAAAELRRLNAYCQELEAHLILDCMTHVQNTVEIEHVAGDVSKNGAESNMRAKQPDPDRTLIAAAPDLLEALQDLCKDELHTQDKWDAARAAIAKATGQQGGAA